MYEAILINNGTETTIHYPDPTAPHLLSLNLNEKLSQASELKFSIPIMNLGYNLITELSTKIKVIDTRDNSVKFTGRILNVEHSMGSDGKFTKECICESAMAYLLDTNTRRWHFGDQTPSQILTYLLSQHNSKVDSSRQIQLGTIEITQSITVDTNYETTLNAIITKLHNILGGDFRVRESGGVLYLDYLLAQGSDNNVEISLGYNMKEITLEHDPTDLATRVIPLGYGQGVNQLTIKSVNSNIDYIEDATAISTYGRIEAVINNSEIQNANTLKIWGQNMLSQNKQPRLTLGVSMMDLSVLSGHDNEKFGMGDTLHINNSIMNINDYIARVIEIDTDLFQPWDPKLTISTKPLKFSDQIVDLKQRNLILENAPQGSTYIDTFGYAENIDADHSFSLPIWISPDVLYLNRVRLHVDSQKFRAYEKGMTVAAQGTSTSTSGGGSTQTSSSAGESTQTSSSGGGETKTSSSGGEATVTSDNFIEAHYMSGVPENSIGTENWGYHVHEVVIPGHNHNVSIPSHTHSVTTSNHTHTVSTPAHTHNVSIPEHSHDITIPSHNHNIEYGIFEDTYPADVTIKINNTVIPNIVLSEGGSLDIDISEYLLESGQTYNLEVTSSRNGRVNVWASIQAFIQIK